MPTVETDQLVIRKGTAAQWAASDPVLLGGELGWDSTNDIWKGGNGAQAWSARPTIFNPAIATVTLAASYGNSLATAISSIGGAKTMLYVDADYTETTTRTVPTNIRLIPIKGAVITVNTGVTLTIKNFDAPPSEQVFAGAGTVIIGSSWWDACWWCGNDPTAEHTTMIDMMLRSIDASGGAEVKLPNFRFRTQGGHLVHRFTNWKGNGFDIDSAASSGFKLIRSSNDTGAGLAAFVFKIEPYPTNYVQNVKWEGFSIDVTRSNSATHKAVWLTNTNDNHAAHHIQMQIAVNASSATTGTLCFNYDTGATNFYVECVDFSHSSFVPAPNTAAVKLSNPNCSFLFNETIFQLPTGSTAIWCNNVGTVKGRGTAFNGPPIVSTPNPEAVSETITGSITTGTKVLTMSREPKKADLGMRVTIPSISLDTYISDFDGNGNAIVKVAATGTATNASLNVYRFSVSSVNAAIAIRNTGIFSAIDFENTQDEGVNYYFKNELEWYRGRVTFRASHIQGMIRCEASCVISDFGCTYFSGSWQDAAGVEVRHDGFGNTIEPMMIWNANWPAPTGSRTLDRPSRFGDMAGISSISELGGDQSALKNTLNRPLDVMFPNRIWAGNPQLSRPVRGSGSDVNGKPLDRVGIIYGENDEWRYYRDTFRDTATGEYFYKIISPNFPEYSGYRFEDAPVAVDGFKLPPTRPASITTTPQNNYNAGDAVHAGKGAIILTSDGAGMKTITGWFINGVVPKDGTIKRIRNGNAIGGDTFRFTNQDALSTAAYRFFTPGAANFDLAPREVAELEYDNTAGGWFIIKIG